MIFKKLTITEGLFKKEIAFDEKSNLIFSDKNSRGKTTLLRFMLYALGYPIPMTKGIKIDKFQTGLEVNVNQRQMHLFRSANILTLRSDGKETIFTLPVENEDLLNVIYGISDKNITKNLLGSFYFDQEKGWTLLNRGTVIGKIKLNIEELMRGLAKKNCDSLIDRRDALSKQIHRYKTMFNIAEYKKQVSREIMTDDGLTYNEELERALNGLFYKRNALEREIGQIDSIIRQNNSFVKYIAGARIVVVNSDGIEIPVTENTIKGSPDNTQLTLARKNIKLAELSEIKGQIKNLSLKRKETNLLWDVKEIVEKFDRDVSNMEIDARAVENILKKLEQEKRDINTQIEELTRKDNESIMRIHTDVLKYAEQLGLNEIVEKKEKYIFTRELAGLSGAILHKLVFAFKMAYIKEIAMVTELKLPIILDSPKGSEVDDENISAMMNILKDDFSDHQIILSSIFNDYQFDFNKIIEIKVKLMSDAILATNLGEV
ncbi:MAG: hypothetical protein FWE16_02310 [Firmicutes bacterium]|nr:hypothetical protein [Bacillota bacterium]